DVVRARLTEPLIENLLNPGSAGIDQGARLKPLASRQLDFPCSVTAPRGNALDSNQDSPPATLGVQGIADHQTRIVDAAIRVDEAVLELWLEARVVGGCIQPYGSRAGQKGAPCQVVIEEQPDPNHPAGPQLRDV